MTLLPFPDGSDVVANSGVMKTSVKMDVDSVDGRRRPVVKAQSGQRRRQRRPVELLWLEYLQIFIAILIFSLLWYLNGFSILQMEQLIWFLGTFTQLGVLKCEIYSYVF